MNVLEKAEKILQQPVCDRCLGRQFAQLLSGYTNDQRGRMLRTAVAMSIDRSKGEEKEGKTKNQEESQSKSGAKSSDISMHVMDKSNFAGYIFHNLESDKSTKAKKCSVCGDFFASLDKWARKIETVSKGREIRTFLVGTKLPFHMIEAEEALWERVGIDYCEPIKAEINRELGKLVETKLKIKFHKIPDVNFIINVETGKVALETNPVFVYGEYQKLVRGIPQTKWPSRKYRTSVEEIIAKPFLPATGAKGHKLHGLGREDIDARCLGWRPFVIEFLSPVKRTLDLRKLEKKVGSGIRVRNMKFSNIAEVRKIKEAKAEKTYTILVECGRKITNSDLKRLRAIKDVNQKTPERVLHRRADKYRKRKVKSLKATLVGSKKFRLTLRTEAGLYVKELVSGDGGRTEPSVSQLLDTKCIPRDLDVLQIHAKF